MNMNMKMKTLSLALVGLAGFGFAGAAAAGGGCPSSPSPPWTSVTGFQGSATIVPGGLASTACRLDAVINVGAGAFASAQVLTDSPADEPRYRAQFIVNMDNLPDPGFADSVYLMLTLGDGTDVKLGAFGDGTGAWRLSYFVPGAPSGSVPLAAGENVIEIDLQVGASGSFDLWVNNNDSGNPTVSLDAIDTSALVGITDTYLGLTAATGAYVVNYGGDAVQFDQFDSRRSTFIGL